MFKAIKDNKIIAINETGKFLHMDYDAIEEDAQHSVDDFAQLNGNGEFMLKSDIPAPTIEEQKEKRAQAYLIEVDPITAHIQRLRDDAQTTEDFSKIAELMLERDAKVEDIKNRYPYPEEEE